MISRRAIFLRQRIIFRQLSSNTFTENDDAAGVDDKLLKGFEEVEQSEAAQGSLVRIREFFDKYKPSPKPAPTQPKKKWLLRMQPPPEEETETPETVPAVGDVEGEKEWLLYGNQPNNPKTTLITETDEYKRLADDIQRELKSEKAPRSSPNISARRLESYRDPAFTSISVGSRLGPDLDYNWLHEGEQSTAVATEGQGREGQPDRSERKQHTEDGFADFMDSLKSQKNSSPSAKALSSTEEALYRELLEEHMAMESTPNIEPAKPYDYNPRQPRWLDPPDGDYVGAVPQREYNDFTPEKDTKDFWNESSIDHFEDPGQDPDKPNRFKLFGQEYWVAAPMLMEKYDYGTDGPSYEVEGDKHKDIDPEIPRHFLEDGSLPELTIEETEDYSDFFDFSKQDKAPRRPLFTMNGDGKRNIVKVVIDEDKVTAGNKVLNGYTVPREQNNTGYNEVKEWLEAPDLAGQEEVAEEENETWPEIHDADDLEKFEGFGKYEANPDQSDVLVPTRERIEEIKQLEGLEPIQVPRDIGELDNESESFADKVSHGDLQRLMEAERYYNDIFSNEKSEDLPDLRQSSREKAEALRKLNSSGIPPYYSTPAISSTDVQDTRSLNQLLRNPSKSDFDPWLVKELEKYVEESGTYGDLFSLACHPRMLEAAFSSLRKRRPGSVPRLLESEYFEMTPVKSEEDFNFAVGRFTREIRSMNIISEVRRRAQFENGQDRMKRKIKERGLKKTQEQHPVTSYSNKIISSLSNSPFQELFEDRSGEDNELLFSDNGYFNQTSRDEDKVEEEV